ncbi:diaminopimelate epimerase [Algoriphagus sp. CAU 1675]|uniref:diaminopimelate epimerase n=1 Tax=Algoriphagus sp. CAU 1675 TaxID=3032597 RepID=UPI0023DB3084|nr:diaminopimelate epimerase [Algoriphagus sp. CAU 1675]MDF2156392.1 diaminopimelate epimerase [Algoriphagus sp. CAU 1675]
MKKTFYKYQGTGNDFVMIDDRSHSFDDQDLKLVSRLCDRKFGIGADGLILIRNHPNYDFEMIYFNADGSQSMCGNGARCAVAFAGFLGIIEGKTSFRAIDGPHEALLAEDKVELLMGDVAGISKKNEECFINTGSPHHIRFVKNIEDYPVFEEGKSLRYSQEYSPAGTNVNFVQPISDGEIFVRTYERGVENETLSCGTGVTAAAIAYAQEKDQAEVKIKTLGGNLSVRFHKKDGGGFDQIWLIGPAEQVFQGEIEL